MLGLRGRRVSLSNPIKIVKIVKIVEPENLPFRIESMRKNILAIDLKKGTYSKFSRAMRPLNYFLTDRV